MTDIEIKARIYDLLIIIEQAKAEISKLENQLTNQPKVQEVSSS